MKFVEEIVVDEFLPTFRSMLAEALRERGLTQNEVAALLGISQSAVSKYVHGEVERNEALLDNPRLQELVTDLGDKLADGDITPVEALIETEVCIREFERGGILAELHTEAVPALESYEGHFAVHDPDSRLRQASQVRASIRRGLRILRNTGGFPERIPNVGSNLVECLPDAETVEDVAAVPGRLLAIHGQLTVPGEPEFGVSQHVAGLLLAARANGSEGRAALNVSDDPSLRESFESEGYVTAEFDAESDFDRAIADALLKEPEADVLYQTGGYGIEPVLYVLGPDAPTVAKLLRDLDG